MGAGCGEPGRDCSPDPTSVPCSRRWPLGSAGGCPWHTLSCPSFFSPPRAAEGAEAGVVRGRAGAEGVKPDASQAAGAEPSSRTCSPAGPALQTASRTLSSGARVPPPPGRAGPPRLCVSLSP